MNILHNLPKFPAHEGAPKLTYAICCTERTGSTLLARELWATGVCGAPYEFFNPVCAEHMALRDLWWNYTSPNGVFGMKVHWKNAAVAMSEVYPDKYIYLRRENRVAQAVSLVLAQQTGEWFKGQVEKSPAPVYDFEAIQAAEQYIRDGEAAWEEFFSAKGARVLRLAYENHLAAGPVWLKETVSEVLNFLGLVGNPADYLDVLPQVESQHTELNDLWETRYREECAVEARPNFSLLSDDYLSKLFQGDASAIEFVRVLLGIVHTWDDLIDRDCQVADSSIHAAFINALIILPRNTFYQRWMHELQPLMSNAITDWLVANKLEHGTRSDKAISFITRSSYASVIQHAITLACGWQHAIEQAPVLRQVIHQEGFQAYLNSIK